MKVQMKVILAIALGILLVATGCTNNSENPKKTQQDKKVETKAKFEIVEADSLKFKNIRGIGYPGNDNALYVATNAGLKFFKDSKWYESSTNQHDFIGFQAVEDGFIGSGHPKKGTGLKDPLGVVRSVDKGKTIDPLAFYGKKNFHFLASSFSGQGLYIINEAPSEDLNLGVSFSKNNGDTWTQSAFKGFTADSLGMIAVHPENGDIMAMSTRTGIYYSTDNGNTMKPITGSIMVTSLTFSGDSILYSSVENDKILLKTLNPVTNAQGVIEIPFLDYDNPITYLAVNQKDQNQMAFTTYKNDMYESHDGGKKWTILLKNGKKEQE